ncbi:WRKY transcription factor, variant 2 [Trifolium repens]|nr:WRKY transcription factor, variant 2 [Trifolium repens]
MEKKEMGVKSEEDVNIESSSLLNNYQFSSVFDFCEVEKNSPLGFMELLGVQDYNPLLDVTMSMKTTTVMASSDTGKDSSEVLNQQQQPATPNSCSISSASSEAVNDNKLVVEQTEDDDDEGDAEEKHQKTNKQLKTKKTNQKKQREPRFAFMTKSEVDHLEDGYRWRKYGQKAVKNSPFPRSYYRCTTVSCNVKKRVERSFTNPSIVVTTYEGQHTHPSPAMSRSAFIGAQIAPPAGLVSGGFPTNYGSVLQGNYLSSSSSPQYHQQHQHQQLLVNTLSSMNHPYYNSSDFTQERKLCNQVTTSAFLRDHGLLQDVVPSHMLKEE